MRVKIERVEEVSKEAVTMVCDDFLEWLEDRGWKIEPRSTGTQFAKDSFAQLANRFAEEQS